MAGGFNCRTDSGTRSLSLVEYFSCYNYQCTNDFNEATFESGIVRSIIDLIFINSLTHILSSCEVIPSHITKHHGVKTTFKIKHQRNMTACGPVRKVELNKLKSLIVPFKSQNLAKMHLDEIYNSLSTAMQPSQSTRKTRKSPIWIDRSLYLMLTKVKELYRSQEWEPYKILRKIY